MSGGRGEDRGRLDPAETEIDQPAQADQDESERQTLGRHPGKDAWRKLPSPRIERLPSEQNHHQGERQEQTIGNAQGMKAAANPGISPGPPGFDGDPTRSTHANLIRDHEG